MVRPTGLEPVRPYEREILSLLRLPVSPRARTVVGGFSYTMFGALSTALCQYLQFLSLIKSRASISLHCMEFSPPLVKARLVKRYKRFLADILLEDGSESVAHCANTGSMLGLCEPGSTIYVAPNTNPKAKLDYRWEMIDVGSSLVGINTSRANAIVEEAIEENLIAELLGYTSLKREVKYGENSRIDILLSGPTDDKTPDICYVEVKSVTLKSGAQARFPDAVTTRGAKHLAELTQMVNQGHRAVMLFLIQRGDCTSFSVAGDIDPNYAEALSAARNAGVEILVYDCTVTQAEIKLKSPVKIQL